MRAGLHRVVITGMGAITPYGSGVSALRNGILEGRSALKYSEKLGFVVGEISPGAADFDRWTPGQRREMSRASQLALLAAEETLTSANALSLMQTDTLVNIGTGVTDLETIGETHKLVEGGQTRRVSPYFVPRILNNLPAGYVAMQYGMMGGAESCSTACATGLHSIGNAFRAVRHGWAQRAIAGAAEGCVNPVALAGFDRMRALARGQDATISRPFDVSRQGFVLSEGVGLLFLERLEDAKARGAPIRAEVFGFGISSDCYHISAPHPSGIGARLSMQRALEDAELPPKDISYINAHATSTPTGDAIEAKAIKDLFIGHDVAVSSVKGHIGHLLAAAGAVETIATAVAVGDGRMPPNLNTTQPEEVEHLNILKEMTSWPEGDRRLSVVNSFGFGGTNASLIIGRFEE